MISKDEAKKLRKLIREVVLCEIDLSWKGNGDPEYIPIIEEISEET